MFNIINHQRNANQNHNEIPLHMFKFLCGCVFAIFLGIFLVVELLDHMISLLPFEI